jgi:hypothetical protein
MLSEATVDFLSNIGRTIKFLAEKNSKNMTAEVRRLLVGTRYMLA